ncbi:MAG: bifunctional glutamate N-acetyltransferase/amino-acid acetyltransferase ArgJ [Dehalococcoidia bacterium]|nr:bifunctional glutamate N-acetyltransferase/amino-acid acetyltransferase ArgJ [Dehalococcoidia bacterium]
MFDLIPSGSVSSASGFLAGAVHAGIKSKDELDLAILCSEVPCKAAGVFTTNQIKSAPVILSQRHITKGRAQAIAVNSGCANACTGEQGLADALGMANLAAAKLGISPEEVLVASTGVIGVPLPMDKIRAGISKIKPTRRGGHDFCRAIMTTDTRPKEMAVQVDLKGAKFTIGGVAKGAGMVHPNLATMLCFIATDAVVSADFLQAALQKAVDCSFNMVSIDGDTSPSDCAFLLANGLAGNEPIDLDNGEVFKEALNAVCTHLAKSIARDGEGATKLIEVIVEGAEDQVWARQAARTIVSSPLVKAAIHGNDPNWGRIVAALGRSGARVREDRLDVYLNDVCVMKQGSLSPFSKAEMISALSNSDNVLIRLCLNFGDGQAITWGCDLSEEYVTINSAYTT